MQTIQNQIIAERVSLAGRSMDAFSEHYHYRYTNKRYRDSLARIRWYSAWRSARTTIQATPESLAIWLS